MTKMKVDELLRRACLAAERDQESFIDAYGGDESEPAVAEAVSFLCQLRSYRLRRWGKTALESTLESCKSIAVQDLLHKKEESPDG